MTHLKIDLRKGDPLPAELRAGTAARVGSLGKPGRQANFRRDNTRYGKRHTPGQMNKTEEAFAADLVARERAGEILGWMFEPLKFRLADRCFFTPDFLIFHNDCTFEFVDVKGGGPINEGAIIKGKCAAEKFWCFKFSMAQRLPKRGGWKWTEF